jgi:hypothetical protein
LGILTKEAKNFSRQVVFSFNSAVASCFLCKTSTADSISSMFFANNSTPHLVLARFNN